MAYLMEEMNNDVKSEARQATTMNYGNQEGGFEKNLPRIIKKSLLQSSTMRARSWSPVPTKTAPWKAWRSSGSFGTFKIISQVSGCFENSCNELNLLPITVKSRPSHDVWQHTGP